MNETERELDLALAEALQENRKLSAENDELRTILEVERMAVKDMGNILSNYEDLVVEMKAKIDQLESEQ